MLTALTVLRPMGQKDIGGTLKIQTATKLKDKQNIAVQERQEENKNDFLLRKLAALDTWI